MAFKILSVCLLAVGMGTTAMAASSDHGGGDRGGWGDSPGAEDNNNYRSTIIDRSDTAGTDEKDPNACWTLPRSADGKSIVAPSQANPIVPRKCN
ncbi:hypothetical protein [Rhizobium rhizogenes]|uniref:hypothetical protein n=1 Tax=Rhizobium rhizogenes TaxID=359 RepID=UPI00157377BE|nr:hypothetical protein [Rhizobium rhizogenes]NTG40664.1 hypothetical protein [Rhizobium rhizogenes]NTG49016.1 hypothetical protein [Rhizobium rhizogenes]NTH18142.1 hypothetical protein [Rhizobium rhizogenes]NTH31114.1 hypothetical protein [Rhizobium rhizogenes]NTI28288.1 hypothetical protein [Rhizobium rhizogenes]